MRILLSCFRARNSDLQLAAEGRSEGTGGGPIAITASFLLSAAAMALLSAVNLWEIRASESPKTERGKPRVEWNKMNAVLTHFLNHKSTLLSTG